MTVLQQGGMAAKQSERRWVMTIEEGGVVVDKCRMVRTYRQGVVGIGKPTRGTMFRHSPPEAHLLVGDRRQVT